MLGERGTACRRFSSANRSQGAATPSTPGGAGSSASDGRRVRSSRAARAELRRQIAKLERELAELFASTFPRLGIEWTVGAAGGPRVLGIAELESIRDALADRLRRGSRRDRAPGRGRGEPTAPCVERMIADPAEHRWVRVRSEDVGERELQALALASALGAARHARRLVAGQALLGLSLSLRVVPRARPAPKITSTAAATDGFLEVP